LTPDSTRQNHCVEVLAGRTKGGKLPKDQYGFSIIDMTGNDADKWPSRRPNQHPSGKAFDPAQLICAISQLRNGAAPRRTAAVGGLSEPYTTLRVYPREET
jgi:hypothetical protein